jgi:phosphoribosylaminoimidazole-succinocarboxamide synthase
MVNVRLFLTSNYMIPVPQIQEQLKYCLKGTNFTNLGERYEGKVRDNYTKEDKRIIVVSDRLSAFDRIITMLPFKGQVLNQMAQFWFNQTMDIIGNHVIECPDPNVIVGEQCTLMPAEMIVRGYITGVTKTSAWYNYEHGVRNFCGNVLPEGLKKNQQLEKPILTPTTKGDAGAHDENLSKEEFISRGIISKEDFEVMEKAAFALYSRGVEIASKQGIILVDTKYEFGKTKQGKIILIDEIHTPDSSRFWFRDEYDKRFSNGEEQKKIDKEYVREWLAGEGFLGDGEIPVVPDDVRVEGARRYIEAFELITGQTFNAEVGDPLPRIEKNLQKYM